MNVEDSAGQRSWSVELTPDELHSRLGDLSLPDLVARFAVDHEYDDYYEAVAEQLYAQGRAGGEVLGQELLGRRVPQLRAALTVLALHQGEDPAFCDTVKTLASGSDPLVIADAIRLLGSLGATDMADKVRRMSEHEAAIVRAAVLDYLARAEPASARPALMRGLGDSDYIVRETAIDALEDLGATDAISAIEALIDDPHEDVRLAARTAVDNLRDRSSSAD
ncbi:HEAT repeat domain-containing protein [Nocardia cyriacigeorgica]|uniref:HEAT repeat domain-containing protein n=1 Tax=Nocardia cyriacigeorgica TaxID=135487 RepID=UPI001486DF51|nr:HEAT repeat domain-containing protein [Nocardia cyriacigeorgica]